jgi:LmbE family N-acetylglucosaminyl deacetylase
LTNHLKRILVLAPHTDDGEMGAGGTIARLNEEGSEIYYVAFSSAAQSVPDGFPSDVLTTEVKAATFKLCIPEDRLVVYDFEVRKLNYVRQEILESLVRLRTELAPDLVLVPSINDIHQDHAVVAAEAVRAFKNTRVLGYELIWNNLTFNTQFFVKLNESHVDAKIAALGEYRSQAGKNYMDPVFVKALAKTRGVQIGYPYAEAFEVIRWVMN